MNSQHRSVSAADYYNDQILSLNSSLKKTRKFFPWLYLFRLATFVSFITFLVLFFQFEFNFYFLSLSIFSFVLFLVSVKSDLKFVYREKYFAAKLLLSENELKFIDHQYKDHETGEEFISLNPHLSIDFDLFGKGSLFQYLNRSTTLMGKKRLAQGLTQYQYNKDLLSEKQEAIQDLSDQMDFIQEFRTQGMFVKENGDEIENLESWMSELIINRSRLKIVAILIPLINAIWILLIIAGIFTIVSYLLPFFLSSYILLINSKQINKAHSMLGNTAKTFEKYASLIELIEKANFKTVYISTIRNSYFSGESKASISLTSLFKLLNKFDLRLNILVSLVLNALLLYDIQILLQLENWKAKHKNVIISWFVSLAEMDYLISMAVFAFNNKDLLCLPKIKDDEFTIEAEDLGHPLLHPSIRICNDISMKGNPSVLIITGANMAGKSTFLRTISINLIMAMNGAPVCAKSFKFTPCEVMSSIKIQDSLSNHESYFYAELIRLKEIINHVQENTRMLIILDEILRGTNSKDKHQGSIGLLERLIKLNATVIIATHDLGIAELQDKYPATVSNNCFEVELINDQLIFDYKIKKGVSQKLNASFLMKKMEIIN